GRTKTSSSGATRFSPRTPRSSSQERCSTGLWATASAWAANGGESRSCTSVASRRRLRPRCRRLRRGRKTCGPSWTVPDPDLRPGPDEIELSIFGPGFGECLLVHLGDADWMMVDSCMDQRHRQQPALTYLREMG